MARGFGTENCFAGAADTGTAGFLEAGAGAGAAAADDTDAVGATDVGAEAGPADATTATGAGANGADDAAAWSIGCLSKRESTVALATDAACAASRKGMRDATVVVTSATASSRPKALARADTAALPISMLMFLCCSGSGGAACCCAGTWSPPLVLPALVPLLLVNCWMPGADADSEGGFGWTVLLAVVLLDALEGLFAPDDDDAEAEADGAPATGAAAACADGPDAEAVEAPAAPGAGRSRFTVWPRTTSS